jgi:hypothetical protein
MNDRLRINAPAVVSETIDGEAVIMNLKSGSYYSTDEVGSEIWNWIEKGWRRQAMLDALATMYAADHAQIATAVGAFLDDLIAQGLVVPDDDANPGPANADAPAAAGGKQTFAAPTLNVYTDMKDLLLLDPIHDVDEVGWPTPKPQSP